VRALPGDAIPAATALAVAVGAALIVELLILLVHDPAVGVAQLFAVPAALVAVRFGLHAGVGAAAVASVLTVVGDVLSDASPGPAGYTARFVVFFVVAVLVGWFADRAREDIRLGVAVNAELERSNGELEQFAYIASHDLAEPLRTITGFTELLGRRYTGQLDEKADRYIEHIVNGTTRMQRLIDDLLAYSRVGRMEIAPEPFALGDALDQVCAALSSTIAERGAVITRGPLPVVFADPPQIAQVLQNLVGNAMKFQAPGETPAVHVAAEADDGMWRVTVADNGIGIDPRFAHRVFRMFQRLHAQHEYSGTGIGLAICQRIVERNGGRIWVEPGPDGGSTFSFTLPGAP
jgi:signal transduction histidine kinase